MSDPYTAPDFSAAALITIDTQRDVLDGGSLEIPGTTAALAAIGMLVRAFRAAGRPIVHVVRLYEPDGSNVDISRREAVRNGARMLIAGTEGSQLAGELLPDPELVLDDRFLLAGGIQDFGSGEVAIYKPRWGAFYRTPVEDHLRAHGVSTAVFCGCNFPNCPRASIYEASERDFRVVLARDATSALYERGERELTNIGVRVLSAREVAETLPAATDRPHRLRQRA
jgi:nicotinamidase-related amidase